MTAQRPRRRATKVPIVIGIGVVALVRALATIGYYAPRPTGPMPEGSPVIEGVVLGYDASDGAGTVIAELRGRRNHPGEVRESLFLVRAPYDDASFESLGRGGTLGSIADDGAAIAWLTSKERGHRTGPGRVRGAAKDAPVIDLKELLPPLAFHPGRATGIGLGAYQPASGRGSLFLFDTASGTSRLLSPNVPPGGFAPLDAGFTFALRRPYAATHAEAVVLPPAGGAVPPIASEVDFNDPRPSFRVAPDGRAVTMRVVTPDDRRSLVRWKSGDAGASTIATNIAAWTLDRDGRAWWIEQSGESTLRVFRESVGGEPRLVGETAGQNPLSVHPLPSGDGAWIALAERACCPRLALAGEGDAPPAVATLRRVIAPPEGWPVALLGALDAGPSVIAVAKPGAPVSIDGGGVLTAAFAPSGRHLALQMSAPDGERIVLADLEAGTHRTLSTLGSRGGSGSPLTWISWHGDTLLHAWRNREWRLDPRNGLYSVTPSAP